MDAFQDIELRHLRYFVAVAEERHFGRAARRLFVSQPSLSYAIAQLEDRLGCQLLDRSDRRLCVVTPSGETLLAHARELATQFEQAVRATRDASRRGTQLRVGYNDGEPLAQRPSLLRAAVQQATLAVAFRRLEWGTEGPTLRRRAVDALLARLPIDLRGLSFEVVLTEPRLLCVRADHALAKRRRVALKDLATVPIVRPVGGSHEWEAYWRGLPRPERTAPGPEVHSPEETFDVVAAGRGACFVPTSMVPDGLSAAVRYVPVDGLAPSALAVVWPRGAPSPGVKALLRAVRTLVAAATGR